jgi:hypothetical protein
VVVRKDRTTVSRRRREKAKAEVRGVVFQLLTAAGLGLGLLWALQPSPKPASCGKKEVLANCAGHAMVDAMWPILIKSGAGALAGMIVAIALCMTVPGLRRRPI